MIEKVEIPVKRSRDTFSATELNQIVVGLESLRVEIENVANQLANKANIIGGYIDPNVLPAIHFSDTSFSGDGSPGNPITVIGASGGGGTVTPTLSAPTLTATAISTTQINLTWNRVSNSTGFILERAINAAFSTGLTTIYTGNDLSYNNTGLGASTLYYFRIRATATGYNNSNYGATSLSTQTAGNTTPATPTLSANDVANTLTANHALGTSEIVMSVNGGNYVTYSPINVGDVTRAAGYWKFKIKAATGRNESAVVNSPAFTASVVLPEEPPVSNNGTPVTSFQYLAGCTLSDTNTVTMNDNVGSANAAPNFVIQEGQSGWISQKLAPFVLAGEGSTALFTLGVGIDPHYGDEDAVVAMYAQQGGQIVYRTQANGNVYGDNGVISINGIIRLRATATTAFIEYSNDNGLTFTTISTAPRPAGNLRCKMGFVGNRKRAVDLRSFNG